MKTKYFILATLVLLIFKQVAFSQTVGHFKNDGINLNSKENDADLDDRSNRMNHLQFSLMVAWNSVGMDKKVKASIKNIAGQLVSEDRSNLKMGVDYIGKKKWGVGASLSSFDENYAIVNHVGQLYHEPIDLFFFIVPGYYEPINDDITIENSAQIFNFYTIYKAVEYSKIKNNPWEISIRTGISIASFNEKQSIYAYKIVESNNINSQGMPIKTLLEAHRKDGFSKTGVSAFLSGLILIHIKKHFSIILADVKQTVGLINPSVKETTVKVDDFKKVTIKEHKLTDAGFSYAFGLAFQF